VPPQIIATPGMPERKAVARRQARVRENLHLLPKDAQKAILDSLEGTQKYPVPDYADEPDGPGRHRDDDADTASIPTQPRH
jgi:phospholipid/cholesterol/gamma-HCH transport system ATP-binding protein